jgi:hypothetical protein
MMNIGMLWFDNDTQSDLSQKIQRAASYYQQKYGKQPDLCYVHPSMAQAPMNGNPGIKTGGIEVKTTKSVLPNNFWIGINGKTAATN